MGPRFRARLPLVTASLVSPQLGEDLATPEVQARLERLKKTRAIIDSARYILSERGIKSENRLYLDGSVYFLEQIGNRLTITNKESQKAIYAVIDQRNRGGLIEVERFDLTLKDQKMINGYAQYLRREKRKQRNQLSLD